MAKNLNPFGAFIQRYEGPKEQGAPVPREAPGGDAAAQVLRALLQADHVDPSELVSVSGLDFFEVARALEQLESLEAVSLTDVGGRKVVQRGPKFDQVRSLLKV